MNEGPEMSQSVMKKESRKRKSQESSKDKAKSPAQPTPVSLHSPVYDPP